MSGKHTIRLKPDAKPFAPRRVAVNLMPQLLKMRVIRRVDKPTPWCAGIVVLSKKTSGIRMCVDLTRLNDSVLREQYTLPAIDQMLARMTGAKLFSKLDCNSGFYQMPLSPETAFNYDYYSIWQVLLPAAAVWSLPCKRSISKENLRFDRWNRRRLVLN
jgi:hypothetical protein